MIWKITASGSITELLPVVVFLEKALLTHIPQYPISLSCPPVVEAKPNKNMQRLEKVFYLMLLNVTAG